MVREIEPELVEWFDWKLSGNGLAKLAIENKDARLVFGLSAESAVGITESGGNNDGPLVRLFQKTIGKAEREPWCMALVMACLAYAEHKTGAYSPVFPSEHCQTVWNKTPVVMRVKTSPLKYAIVIWRYEGSSAGHTGIVVETDYRQWFRSIEGNTNSAGSREGDGVYYKKRDWIRNGSLVRMGFLKPF